MRSCLLVGEFSADALGTSWERGLRAQGVAVTRFDLREARASLGWYLRNRYVSRLVRRSFDLRRFASAKLNQALLDMVEHAKPDAVLIHNGEYVMPQTIQLMRSLRSKVVVFHADNPFPPHYNNRPETIPVALEADLYLVWSELLAVKLDKLGVRAKFLPFAFDPISFPGGEYSGVKWDGALFIGNWDPEREAVLDAVAKRLPLHIFGSHYWATRTHPASLARRAWQGRILSGVESAEEFRGAAVTLNLLRSQHTIDGRPDGLIMRHFEVPGAGGFLLSTRSSGATSYFPEGTRGAYFADANDCGEVVKAWLGQSARRARIAAEARDYVCAGHTYAHRMRELIALVSAT